MTKQEAIDFCKNNPKKAKRVVFELLEDEDFKEEDDGLL